MPTRRPGMADLVARPIDGMLFDMEHNGFWHPEWGPRPAVTHHEFGRPVPTTEDHRYATIPFWSDFLD